MQDPQAGSRHCDCAVEMGSRGNGVSAPLAAGSRCKSLVRSGGTLALPVVVHGLLSRSHLGKVSGCCGTPGEERHPINICYYVS